MVQMLEPDRAHAVPASASTGHYPGFDRFGRVAHHAWVTAGFTTGIDSSVPDRTPLLARAYEYDMDSNRELDYDARPGGAAVRNDRDWQYQYDDLDRLKQANRGRESSGFTLAADSQKWDLDILGNWKTVWNDANGNGSFEATITEQEDRAHNRANEIKGQERPNGMLTQIVTQPDYDDAGNYRQNLNAGSNRLVYTHDAWNRLVKIVRTSGSHTVLENEFNGLNHRIRRRMDLSQGVYDGVDESRWYFYSANWQVLEEHIDTDLDDDTDRIGQQFWGVRYIDDAVARRVDRDGDGTFSGDPDDNFFYLTDVMFSVRALVDGEGRLHTRLDYTPYGVAMHGFAADVNGDGVLNFTDITAFNAVYNGGTALRPGETGYDPDADLSGSGSMNFFDYTAFIGRYNAYASGGSNPTFNAGWIDNPEDPNGPDNSVGYDGYWFDLAGATEATSTGLYMVRHRVYDPKLGRWLQRDPISYDGGQNVYNYSDNSPVVLADYTGLAPSLIQPNMVYRGEQIISSKCEPWTLAAGQPVKNGAWQVPATRINTRNITIPGTRRVRDPMPFWDGTRPSRGNITIVTTKSAGWQDAYKVSEYSFREGQLCRQFFDITLSCSRECDLCVETWSFETNSQGSFTHNAVTRSSERRTQQCVIKQTLQVFGEVRLTGAAMGDWTPGGSILNATCHINMEKLREYISAIPPSICDNCGDPSPRRPFVFKKP